MTAPDPARLAEITARAADCQTYNFGLRAADHLAHNDVPWLLGLVGRQAAALAAVREQAEALDGIADMTPGNELAVEAFRLGARGIRKALEAVTVLANEDEWGRVYRDTITEAMEGK